MGLVIDLHAHTEAYSPCSHIPPQHVVRQAIRAGLDGLVITEHFYQWREKDLAALVAESDDPHFLLLSGFEYSSRMGDILIYGLSWTQANEFPRGLEPDDAVRLARQMGGVCVAAHPTRLGMGFDERIFLMPLNAIEVASVNLKEHEQRLARQLAVNAKLPMVASSDAHQTRDIGRYATEFDYPVQTINDLREAFLQGKFHLVEGALTDRGR